MVSSRMPCTPPASVRTILWLPNPGTVQLYHHIPHGRLRDAVYSPASVRTIPPLPNPGQQPHSLTLNVTVQAHHTHPMVGSRMPCTPLRVCAPSSGFPIRATPSSMFQVQPFKPKDHMHWLLGRDIQLLLLLSLMTVLRVLLRAWVNHQDGLLVWDGSGRRCVTSPFIVYKNGLLTRRGCDCRPLMAAPFSFSPPPLFFSFFSSSFVPPPPQHTFPSLFLTLWGVRVPPPLLLLPFFLFFSPPPPPLYSSFFFFFSHCGGGH